jgi:hypothetical protein
MRTRQKSPPLATYVGMCDVLGVETEQEHTVIVIRAVKAAHFKFIRDENRPKEVEWALSLEFRRPCKLRVLPPDQHYAGAQAPSSSSTYSLGAVAPPPSAHREPVAPRAEPRAPTVQNSTLAEKSGGYQAAERATPARPQGVKENKKVPLSKEELKRKAEKDLVVQAVVQMFGATLDNVEPE